MHDQVLYNPYRVACGLEVKKTTVDAFQSEMLRTKAGGAAALAAAAGLSGIAAGMVAMSMDEMRENAFGLRFEIDGKPVRGVLWDCPFKEGDEVEVVAEKTDDHWNAFAVARPRDRIISLFPHVVSGEIAHYKASFSVWWKIMAGLLAASFALIIGVSFFSNLTNWEGLFISITMGGLVASAILAVVGVNVARKYLPFARIAEGVFTALGWQDVKRINLRKRTFKQLKPGDDAALGVFHFRY